jgi:hypothetical protein
LVQALDKDIVPWVEKHAPIAAVHQQRMDRDGLTPRFTVIFDREGYSPDLFEAWQQRRIAVLSYHRYPAEDWATAEFQPQTVSLANGETAQLQLAERGTRLPKGLWVGEVRKLSDSGEQISLISTHRRLGAGSGIIRAVGSGKLLPLHAATLCIGSNRVQKQHEALKKARAQFAAASLTEPVSEASSRASPLSKASSRENRTAPTPTGKTEARTQGGPASHSRQRSAGAGSLHQIAP